MIIVLVIPFLATGAFPVGGHGLLCDCVQGRISAEVGRNSGGALPDEIIQVWLGTASYIAHERYLAHEASSVNGYSGRGCYATGSRCTDCGAGTL